jgi:hypothetical protein
LKVYRDRAREKENSLNPVNPARVREVINSCITIQKFQTMFTLKFRTSKKGQPKTKSTLYYTYFDVFEDEFITGVLYDHWGCIMSSMCCLSEDTTPKEFAQRLFRKYYYYPPKKSESRKPNNLMENICGRWIKKTINPNGWTFEYNPEKGYCEWVFQLQPSYYKPEGRR